MALPSVTSREAVFAAMAEFDELGQEAFLRKYGFGRARDYVLVANGKTYDSKAIYGAAYAFEHADADPLRPDDFSGGQATVVSKLEELGFQVMRITENRQASGNGPRAWIIRAGRDGRYEHLALEQDVALIGWSQLGELSPELSRDDLKEMIRKAFDEERPASLASQAGQIYRFIHDVSVGDLVVLPLWTAPGHVAVGRVVGEYRYRTDGPFESSDARNTRAVEWLGRAVPYDRFDADFQAAFGQQGTVSEIGVDDAVARLESIAGSTRAWHLLIRWSAQQNPATIERHREVAAEKGAVWWGKLGDPEGRAAIGGANLTELNEQLSSGVMTYVYLYRPGETWQAEVTAVQPDRPIEETDLIPEYYREATGRHHLWLRLRNFKQLEADYPRTRLLLKGDPNPERMDVALRGQSSLLYVLQRDAPKVTGLRERFERILLEYVDARLTSPFGGGHSVIGALRELADQYRESDLVRTRERLKVVWSAGQGNWAKVPWLAFLDERETDTTHDGRYVVYLFREDMSAVYLTIAQGVTRPKQAHGTAKAHEMLRARATEFRHRNHSLREAGFHLDDAIDLRATGGLGTDYEVSTIAYKVYEAGNVPPDADLLRDLETALITYDAYVSGSARPGPSISLEEVAARLYIPSPFLAECLGLLKRKRQLIFYGPPGTGKTYIARELARYVADGDPDRIEIVQFHPSYSYEDFVQGYRPELRPSGELVYSLKDGPLIRLAERARAAPEDMHVLLIDEINRGNLARIFGELLFLLEYRNERIALMYGQDDRGFELPKNLWFIGTMNTADRSIGLIDAALRRRFHFKALFPARPPIDTVLQRWLAGNAPTMSPVAGYVDHLNARLQERFGEHIQVGHSYFMDPALDEQLLSQIWEADIMPFLEEQLFGHEDELEAFSLAAIRAAGRAPETTPEADADDPALRAPDDPDPADADGA